MAAAGIIRPEFGCYGHHRHLSPPPSHAIGLVLVEFAGAENLGNPDRNSTETSCANTFRTGELNMSARISLAALATFLIALSIQGTASARSYTPGAHAPGQAVHRLRASDAFGSINDPTGASFDRSSNGVFFGNRAVGQDPDANVRLELLRDKDIGKY